MTTDAVPAAIVAPRSAWRSLDGPLFSSPASLYDTLGAGRSFLSAPSHEARMTDPTLTQAAEIARRRTFAIISPPDAAKTPLTEHLLRAGGAIQLAGNVRAKGERRRTRSDWISIERERGISVVTLVMTFESRGCVFNLLDTPGHE